MSARWTTRNPAASHTARPPASSAGCTGPPGAAIPIVAPGAIARGFWSRGGLTLEIAVVGRADVAVVAPGEAARRAGPAVAAEARALRQAQLAAPLVGEIAELGVLSVELEPERAGRTVALLGDDQLGEPAVLLLRVVHLVAVDERDQVGVLLDRARLAQVAHVGPALVGVELLGERFQAVADLADLEVLAVRGRVAVRELEIVEHDQVEPVLGLEPPAARLDLQDRDRAGIVHPDRRVGEP